MCVFYASEFRTIILLLLFYTIKYNYREAIITDNLISFYRMAQLTKPLE